MKFREHRGLLAESMETVVDLEGFDALVAYLAEKFKPWGVEVTPELVKAEKYGGFDTRIGWDTWIVMVDGAAVGFTDGDPNGNPPKGRDRSGDAADLHEHEAPEKPAGPDAEG